MTPPYPFHGSFTYPLYRSAQLLHLGWKKYLVIVIPISMIVSLAVISTNQQLLVIVISSIACLLLIPFFALRIDSRWKTIYKATPYFQYPYKGELTDVGYAATSQRGTISLPWSDITACKIGEDFLIFYQGPMVFHILARSFFSDQAQWEAAKALMSSRIRGRS